MKKKLAVVILAAGYGKRLGGKSQKVLRKILDKPILLYLLDTIKKISPDRIIIVVGHKKEDIFEELRDISVEYAEQKVMKGTGDAVMRTEDVLRKYDGDILILCGDVPFISEKTLSNLLERHRDDNNAGTILTTFLENPTGYGRIKRNSDDNLSSIVEELNATESERAIKEINAGIYIFDKKMLFPALKRILPDKVKQEYYLTDVIQILVSCGEKIGTYTTDNPDECMGINNIQDEEKATRFLLRQRGK